MNKINVFFVLVFFASIVSAAEEVYEYELIDEGAVNHVCNERSTSVGPAPPEPCTNTGWQSIGPGTNGILSYNWVGDGTVIVNGEICGENTECKYYNDTYRVVSSNRGISNVIDKNGEILIVTLRYNTGANNLVFGSKALNYVVKGHGDAPDWVYQRR